MKMLKWCPVSFLAHLELMFYCQRLLINESYSDHRNYCWKWTAPAYSLVLVTMNQNRLLSSGHTRVNYEVTGKKRMLFNFFFQSVNKKVLKNAQKNVSMERKRSYAERPCKPFRSVSHFDLTIYTFSQLCCLFHWLFQLDVTQPICVLQRLLSSFAVLLTSFSERAYSSSLYWK